MINHESDRHRIATLAAVLLCALATTAAADSPRPPESYAVETLDGKHVFVMLAEGYEYGVRELELRLRNLESALERNRELPASDDRDHRMAEIQEHIDELKARWPQPRGLNAEYPESGLYPKGSRTPLWTVDFFAFDVNLSADGKFLVRPGPWASSYDDLAIAFYSEGELLRSWKITELIARPRQLPHSISHFTWRSSSGRLDAERGIYVIHTLEGKTFAFDLRTGEQVARPPG